ncbi:MAG: hypothetical protein ThorAB25_23460 [Candidatus Thorarchaeota archaeon AB_25]|nr:MAG: hypothetical protein ThorAB25_23460 [Candidatus Thorarchaeota archaeon AB_25]
MKLRNPLIQSEESCMLNGVELINYQPYVRITLKHGLRSNTLTEPQGRNIKMNQLRNATRVIAIVVTMMVLFSSLQTGVRAQAVLDPVVVLYDANHRQQFDAFDLEEGMNLMLDAVNTSTRYIVRVNTEDLTDTILNDVDILIIAGPDPGYSFSSEEVDGISEMLANGSSLFLSGDPTIDQTVEYWSEVTMQGMGDNYAINDLLDSINVTGVRFSVNDTGVGPLWGDTMFDYENVVFNETYPYVQRLDATTWETSHPIFRNINELYTMTATLKPLELSSGIATGYESSFAQFRAGPISWANYSFPNMTLSDFEQDPLSYSAINGTFPSWMSAFEYDESRIVVMGSTLMFTGLKLPHPDTDLRWFYSGDNARLFMNIMNWLSQDFVETPSAIVPMLVISSAVMVIGVAFYIIKKIR